MTVGGRQRGGRLLVPLLLVAGAVLTALALLAAWAQWQLLDSRAWAGTSERMLERDEIRGRLAQYLVDEVTGVSGGALPAPLGDGLEEAVARELASERSQRIWRRVTIESHRELVALIRKGGSERDVVALDLDPLIRSLARELNVPLVLPPNSGRIQLVAGDQVRGSRSAADRLERTATVLLIAAPLVLVLSIVLAHGWRRRALAGAGVAIAVGGAIVVLARALVGAHVVDVLAPTDAERDAVAAAWSTGTSTLALIAGVAIGTGVVIAVAASMVAPPRRRYL